MFIEHFITYVPIGTYSSIYFKNLRLPQEDTAVFLHAIYINNRQKLRRMKRYFVGQPENWEYVIFIKEILVSKSQDFILRKSSIIL